MWSSKECVWCACDPSERLDALSICLFVVIRLSLCFPSRDSLITGWSPLVCSIGLTESMSSDEPGKRRDA